MAFQRVAVVTGSNKGIGFAIVKDLCSKLQSGNSHHRNGVVYLTSRDETRGRKAIEELNKLGLNPKYHQLDIDDESSVLKLQDHLKETYGGLDILINNAATFFFMTTPAKDFAKTARITVETNIYGTKRVSDALFPILRPHARVVNVSSDDGHLPRINGREPEASVLRKRFCAPDLTVEQLRELMDEYIESAERGDYYERGWPKSPPGERLDTWPNESYIVSKVGVSALTFLQQRQLDRDRAGDDVVVNCAHPGWVMTDLTGHTGEKNIDEGAEAVTWLALLPPSTPENKVPKGGYFWHTKSLVDWVNGSTPTKY